MITSEDGKTVLRSIRESDLETLFRWRNDSRIWSWCRQHSLLDWAQHKDWFFERVGRDSSIKMFAIDAIFPNSRELVGVCGLTDITHLHQRAEFSLYIAPEFQQKGFAKSALDTLFTHGFDCLNLNIIWGETFEENKAQQLFESLGMNREGTRKEFYFKDGKFTDVHLYSIGRDEWLSLHL